MQLIRPDIAAGKTLRHIRQRGIHLTAVMHHARGAGIITNSLFDIAQVSAWLTITVALALLTDYGLLHLLREALERWRAAGLPWGVKR